MDDGHPPRTRREAREAAARRAAAEAAATGSAPVEATSAAPPPTMPTPQVIAEHAEPTVSRPGKPAEEPVDRTGPPTLEDLFAGHVDTHEIPPAPAGRARRQKRRRRWIGVAITVVVLGLVAGGLRYAWVTYEPQIRAVMGWNEPADYESGQAHGEALVTIVAGDDGSAISHELHDAGVTKTPQAFYAMLLHSGQNPTFYPGVFRLKKEMTSTAALKALQDPASRIDHAVLLTEGLTQDVALKTISETLKMPLADLQAAADDPKAYGVSAPTLEGWLFPAMYTFDPGTSAKQIITTLVDRTRQSLDKAGVAPADRQRILTIASIIQREARNEDDFYKVSRVIANRLKPDNPDTHGKLQMDSTAQYGYGEMHDGTASSSAAALKDDNKWNTYVHPGLPAGPIANSGDLAIDAAMHPADGSWLYFVTVNMDTGETVFSTTYAEQQKAVAQMQKWCAAHPDSGC